MQLIRVVNQASWLGVPAARERASNPDTSRIEHIVRASGVRYLQSAMRTPTSSSTQWSRPMIPAASLWSKTNSTTRTNNNKKKGRRTDSSCSSSGKEPHPPRPPRRPRCLKEHLGCAPAEPNHRSGTCGRLLQNET